MKVKSLGKNQTEISLLNWRVLISYETPVAAIAKYQGDTLARTMKTENFYSVTTSKHVNQWFIDNGYDPKTVKVFPQKFFDGLLGE